MELFPFQALNIPSMMCLGMLYDTDVPSEGQKSVHSAFNDSIGMRLFQRTVVNPVRFQYAPLSGVTAFNPNNFYPAWIEIDQSKVGSFGYGADISALTRIVPKLRLPALDARFASTVNNYVENLAMTMLGHRMGNASSVYTTGNGNYLSPQYNTTPEGWWLCCEYDFGAEMELKGLVGITLGSTTQSLMVLGTQQTYLQALVDGVWTDVTHTYDTLRTITNWAPIAYKLPATVKAQRFRLVNKQPTWPWGTTGHHGFSLQFYGNYTGAKPRTLGKYKHMTMLNLYAGTAYAASTVWYFNAPADRATVAGRYCAMTHMSITDDMAQMAATDIYMIDASYNPYMGDVPLPTFRTRCDSVVGRGV